MPPSRVHNSVDPVPEQRAKDRDTSQLVSHELNYYWLRYTDSDPFQGFPNWTAEDRFEFRVEQVGIKLSYS